MHGPIGLIVPENMSLTRKIYLLHHTLSNLEGSAIFTGHVATAGVDRIGLQPWISFRVGAVLAGALAVVRADRHVTLVAEHVVLRQGHVGEPETQSELMFRESLQRSPATFCWTTSVLALLVFPCLVFDVGTGERSLVLAQLDQLLVGEVGIEEEVLHVVNPGLNWNDPHVRIRCDLLNEEGGGQVHNSAGVIRPG